LLWERDKRVLVSFFLESRHDFSFFWSHLNSFFLRVSPSVFLLRADQRLALTLFTVAGALPPRYLLAFVDMPFVWAVSPICYAIFYVFRRGIYLHLRVIFFFPLASTSAASFSLGFAHLLTWISPTPRPFFLAQFFPAFPLEGTLPVPSTASRIALKLCLFPPFQTRICVGTFLSSHKEASLQVFFFSEIPTSTSQYLIASSGRDRFAAYSCFSLDIVFRSSH